MPRPGTPCWETASSHGVVHPQPPALYNSQPFISCSARTHRYLAGFLAHDDWRIYAKPYMGSAHGRLERTRKSPAGGGLTTGNPNTGGPDFAMGQPVLERPAQGILGCTPGRSREIKRSRPPSRAPAGSGVTSRAVAFVRLRTYQLSRSVGMKGNFLDAWSYDAYGQYYYGQFPRGEQQLPQLRERSTTLCWSREPRPTQLACPARLACPGTSSPTGASLRPRSSICTARNLVGHNSLRTLMPI